tara:strand:+ start:21 stop:734 length:714 start_codon:yes stop_codon:yes gene_type:complete
MDNRIMADTTYNDVIKPDLLESAINSSGPVNDEIDVLRNKVFDFAAKEWGISREQIEKLMEKVAYHETGGTMDPKQTQKSGPAGGLYMFEPEPSELYPTSSGSAGDAQTRMLNFLTDTTLRKDEAGKLVRKKKKYSRGLGYDVKYIKELIGNMPDDFSKVNKRLQDVAFLSHLIEHPSPKSGLGIAAKSDEDLKEWYLDIIWAGVGQYGDVRDNVVRAARGKDWSEDEERYHRKYGR